MVFNDLVALLKICSGRRIMYSFYRAFACSHIEWKTAAHQWGLYKRKKPSMLIDHLDGEQTKGKFRNIERKRCAWEKVKMHLIRRSGGVDALVNCLLSERKVILRPKVSGRRGPLMII